MLRRLASCVTVALVAGCATMSTLPSVSPGRTPPALRGHVDFDGNREYLPAPLATLSAASPESTTVFRYRYGVEYDDLDLSVLALFNPLTLLGCPTGSVSVVGRARSR